MSKRGQDIDKPLKRLTEKTTQHNEQVDEKQLLLDGLFFRLFNIDDEEIRLRCRVLKGKSIFTNAKLSVPKELKLGLRPPNSLSISKLI